MLFLGEYFHNNCVEEIKLYQSIQVFRGCYGKTN